jgi:hypothetical protein
MDIMSLDAFSPLYFINSLPSSYKHGCRSSSSSSSSSLFNDAFSATQTI